ncbi:TPA: hypothetical protein G9F27_004968 [Salmonella enterica]|uniref:Uncharacterized protein n=1 Tax=Salmonella enterica TaxID=28901 RepID=A0A743SMP5_SALER|nr:hypothetical protein [Salmonella enterica]
MNIQKYLMFIPFCFFYSANSFSSNGATGKEISAYASAIKDSIVVKGGGVFNKYKGKGCIVRLNISRNGAFSFDIVGGSPDLCNQLSVVLGSMNKLPLSPSEAVYQLTKDSSFDFKP